MEAEAILAQARAQEGPPADWVVFPLLRRKVVMSITGWILGIILGLGLFILIVPVVIPYNYQHGVVAAVVTTLLLGILLFIGVGSLYLLGADIYRLRHAEQYLIVITGEYFVQQEGKKITQVPLKDVHYVTARGTPPPDRDTESASNESRVRNIPGIGESVLGFFLGRGATPTGQRWRRKRARTPTTLAFLDARTDKEVVVMTDTSYGDPFAIAAVLKQHAASARQFVS
ncbi:MAG: hypothetical protein IMW89_11200 [Ktedonobacteraceae bacterium]|nr:hypothetical protein [Ktedonobacteraceae bacterium]